MILEPEDSVCSLESAKKLKKFGVRQDSFWYWAVDNKDIIKEPYLKHSSYVINRKDAVSAYTSAELGVLLLIDVCYEDDCYGRRRYELKLEKCVNNEWLMYYEFIDAFTSYILNGFKVKATTEAEARAKMLIYLLKKKILKAEDL